MLGHEDADDRLLPAPLAGPVERSTDVLRRHARGRDEEDDHRVDAGVGEEERDARS